MLIDRNIRKNTKGETILETLIAMSLLAIGITMASTIMATSIRNINASKNRVVAVNIAKEGLEAIRNIRDTNWLKFNSKKRECWNHDPGTDTCDSAKGTMIPIAAGDYIVYKQPIDASDVARGWKWKLEKFSNNPSSAPGSSPTKNATYFNTTDNKSYIGTGTEWVDLTQLYIVDIDAESNSDNDTAEDRYTNDQDTYNHAWVDEDDALGKDLAKKTVFKRQITISYLSDEGNPSADPAENRMVVRAKVTWQEGKNQFSTDLMTHLSDYLGRENLN